MEGETETIQKENEKLAVKVEGVTEIVFCIC